MTECECVGLPYGVYLYSYALSTADAESEAEHVLRMISGRNPVLGVWLDMEDADGYKERHGKPLNAANGSLYTQICRTFCNRIAGAGVYASKSVLVDILSVSDLPIWVAQWASKCTYSGAYDLWQYSNAGKVDGISVDVDLDYLYKDIPQEQPDATDSGSDNSAEKSTGENLDTLELILEHVASIDEKMK
ncbi:GH25 family lysozyme [Ruminococcus sp.]|uniref:GH25 family lysozyme n=1 Tax=Ruminococcus sp. TaxID=41978 RepID=UPI0025D961BD|nr:GH25 family lysozyme [Ruminococcus sp.]